MYTVITFSHQKNGTTMMSTNTVQNRDVEKKTTTTYNKNYEFDL